MKLHAALLLGASLGAVGEPEGDQAWGAPPTSPANPAHLLRTHTAPLRPVPRRLAGLLMRAAGAVLGGGSDGLLLGAPDEWERHPLGAERSWLGRERIAPVAEGRPPHPIAARTRPVPPARTPGVHTRERGPSLPGSPRASAPQRPARTERTRLLPFRVRAPLDPWGRNEPGLEGGMAADRITPAAC